MAFGGTVASASPRIVSPGEFTTGCCKENMKLLHNTSALGLVLIFFHPTKLQQAILPPAASLVWVVRLQTVSMGAK